MELSSYLAKNEKKWGDAENANIRKMISCLEKHVDVDLRKVAQSDDEVEIFKSLEGWIFNFYFDEFRDGLAHINYSYHEYQKKLIYNFILSITRNKSNIDILYNMLASKMIITEMFAPDEGEYKIVTENFGEIYFRKADHVTDRETKKYLKTLGEQVVDGCHEISFFLIQKDPNLKAATGICTKGLGCNYYHSFVIDRDDNVIDLTASLIMPKEQYYLLNNIQELNRTDYNEYLLEENASKEFDKSKTLYGLLRNALYKQSLSDNKQHRSRP